MKLPDMNERDKAGWELYKWRLAELGIVMHGEVRVSGHGEMAIAGDYGDVPVEVRYLFDFSKELGCVLVFEDRCRVMFELDTKDAIYPEGYEYKQDDIRVEVNILK